MNKKTLIDRMKEYENVPKNTLTKKTPIIIRLDGCHFHTFTKKMNKPFDLILMSTMQETMKYLCEEIQGCVLGYTQSDEISLVLIDYKNINTEVWYNSEVEKICSVSASICTMKFNQIFRNKVGTLKDDKYYTKDEIIKTAYFDARCFNLPQDEVHNYILWRQQDTIRNSIQMVAQTYYSQKQLQGLKYQSLKDKLLAEKGVDYDNDFETYQKLGTTCRKIDGKWMLDYNMPLLKEDNRYVNNLILHHPNTLEIAQAIIEGGKSDRYIYYMETLMDTVASLDEDKLKALLEVAKVL